jgi:hypothetical protein
MPALPCLSAALALSALAVLARHFVRVRRQRRAVALALRSARVAFDVRQHRAKQLATAIERWCEQSPAGSGR